MTLYGTQMRTYMSEHYWGELTASRGNTCSGNTEDSYIIATSSLHGEAVGLSRS